MNKFYVWPSFDDIDLAPKWQVRKKLFLFFSSCVCEFDHKDKAEDMASNLNKKASKEQANG